MSDDLEKKGVRESDADIVLGAMAGSPSTRQRVRESVRTAIDLRRQVIMYSIAKKLLACVEEMRLPPRVEREDDAEQWTRIESLSQLRATVGGRFQNLKQRWVKAGFPLREHRGDRQEEAEIDPRGWIDLSLWVSKQGFEARLAGESSPWLFEVKANASEDEGD